MKTGTADLLPRWNLFDSVAFITGGAYRPPASAQWTDVSNWLESKGYGGMEYVTFIAYASKLKHERLAALNKANFVCCSSTRDSFLAWRLQRSERTGDLAARQTKHFVRMVDAGYSMRRMFLENMAEVAAPVMLELSFRFEETYPLLCQEARDRCSCRAYIWLLGCPDYLQYCPRVVEDLNKGDDSEFRRSLDKANCTTAPS